MRYVHIIVSEGYLGCQRHSGCKDMCLESNKKILVTILILFLKFHISSFLRFGFPLSYLKKENIWNFKNNIKIAPKIFYLIPGTYLCIQSVSDILGIFQKQ